MKVILFTLCFFVAFLNFANAGKFYSCIDRDGNQIFTDTPQDGMKCDFKSDDGILPSQNTDKIYETNDVRIDGTMKRKLKKDFKRVQQSRNTSSKYFLAMPSYDCYKEAYINMKSMDANCLLSLIDNIILNLPKDCGYQYKAFQWVPQASPSAECQQEFRIALQAKYPQVQKCYKAPANSKCKEQMNNYFIRGALGPDNCTKVMERMVNICGDDLLKNEKCYKDHWPEFETTCNKAVIPADKYDTDITNKIIKRNNLNTQNNEHNNVWKDKNKQLIDAIKKGSLSDVQSALAEGAVVNLRDDSCGTPLECAAARGKIEIAKLLIAKGADVNAMDNIRQQTALHVAVIMNKTEVAKLLIRNGADVNTIDFLKHTPLHDAAMRGNADLVKLLVESGANMKVFINAGTPLHYAARANSVEVAKILIERGVNVDIRDIANNTPLHSAACYGRIEVAKYLISKGADVNARGVFQYTPLHRAAQLNKIEIAKLLIKNGADVTLKGGHGESLTPAMLAEKNKFSELAAILRK